VPVLMHFQTNDTTMLTRSPRRARLRWRRSPRAYEGVRRRRRATPVPRETCAARYVAVGHSADQRRMKIPSSRIPHLGVIGSMLGIGVAVPNDITRGLLHLVVQKMTTVPTAHEG
jgi:hypothetical protein